MIVHIYSMIIIIKTLWPPFLWMRFNCLKATESLQGDSLLFNIQFLEVSGTQLMELRKMKGSVDLVATQWF